MGLVASLGALSNEVGASMLTDVQCKAAQGKDKPYKLADSAGLYLYISPTGHRSWRMKYRFHGKEKRLTFGPYPDVKLADARSKRDAARALLREHIDPSVEAKRRALLSATNAVNSFEAIARRWHTLHEPRWKAVHANDVIRSLQRDVFPSIGSLPIVGLEAPMILRVLRDVEGRGSIDTARRLRQRISDVFVFAIAEGIAIADPAASLAKAMKAVPPKKKRPAVTTIEGARSVLAASDAAQATPTVKLASRLLALTAQRPGMVRTMPWEEIEGVDWSDPTRQAQGALWRIPPHRMKLELHLREDDAFEHVVPLSAAAVEVLRAIWPLTGGASYVFPFNRGFHKPISENAIGYLYNREGFKGRHVPHGWRSSFSTIMNERAQREGSELDRFIIDLMLAHVPQGMSASELAYNRSKYLPRQRELFETWAGLIIDSSIPATQLLEGPRRSVW